MVGAPSALPAAPKAGKRAVVSFAVTRSDNGLPMSAAKLTSVATIGGKAVAHVHSFNGGIARVSVAIPAGAKGSCST